MLNLQKSKMLEMLVQEQLSSREWCSSRLQEEAEQGAKDLRQSE